MKRLTLHSIVTLLLLVLFAQDALTQVQFRVPIAMESNTRRDTLFFGISGDGPGGAINDNTYDIDTDPSFGIPGFYVEQGAPPDPPSVTLRSRIVNSPGRSGRSDMRPWDFRGFTSASQLDTFAFRVYGDTVIDFGATLRWPNNLNLYGTQWTLYTRPSGSSTVLTQVANMLAVQSYALQPTSNQHFVIIKAGALAPTPGPTFVLSTPSLNFGTVAVGGNSTVGVTVTNTGTANNLSITGATPIADYSVVANPPGSFPITVLPGGSRTFDVTFSPTSSGTAAGNILFSHNAPGSPTPLAVTGVGQAQGGTLQFAAASRVRFDNTDNYRDTIRLVNYVGQPLKALQFRFITNGLIIVHDVAPGNDLPGPSFGFSHVIARGSVGADGATRDTVKIFLFGNGSSSLPAGSYNDFVRFSYDVVNITEPDQQSTTVNFAAVLGSLSNGTDAGVSGGPAQGITVTNRTLRGDINNDDRLDILDLLLIIDHILNRITLTGDEFTRADVAPWPGGDGQVNALDFAMLQDIILNGAYPDGTPITRPAVIPAVVTRKGASHGGSVTSSTVDAKFTFHITESGIAVRMENTVPVKGMQLEFESIPTIPPTMTINTVMGEARYRHLNTLLRTLFFSQAGELVPPGDRIVANIPFELRHPADVSLEKIVVADEHNQELRNISTEISLTEAEELPVDFALLQNFPNPFNPTTSIKFSVPQTSDVRISIYNLIGQEVRTLFAGQMDRGTKVVAWDGRDNKGRQLSSGTYVYRMTAGSFVESRKMMFLK